MKYLGGRRLCCSMSQVAFSTDIGRCRRRQLPFENSLADCICGHRYPSISRSTGGTLPSYSVTRHSVYVSVIFSQTIMQLWTFSKSALRRYSTMCRPAPMQVALLIAQVASHRLPTYVYKVFRNITIFGNRSTCVLNDLPSHLTMPINELGLVPGGALVGVCRGATWNGSRNVLHCVICCILK